MRPYFLKVLLPSGATGWRQSLDIDGVVWFYVQNIASCKVRNSQGGNIILFGWGWGASISPFGIETPKIKSKTRGWHSSFILLFPKSGRFWVDSHHHLGSVFIDALMYWNLELISASPVICWDLFSLLEVYCYVMPCWEMTLTWQ